MRQGRALPALQSLPTSPAPAGTHGLLTAASRDVLCSFPAGIPGVLSADRQELPGEDKSGSWHVPVTLWEAVMESSSAGRYLTPLCCQSPASQSASCTHWEVRPAHSILLSAATAGLMVPEYPPRWMLQLLGWAGPNRIRESWKHKVWKGLGVQTLTHQVNARSITEPCP